MVRRTLTLPVEPQRLWPTMTEPERAARWLGGRIVWDLTPGAEVRFTSDAGERRVGRIDEVETERTLRWTWWPEGDEEGASEVTWTLAPDGEGTELTVTEAPVASVDRAWTAGDDWLLGVWALLQMPVATA